MKYTVDSLLEAASLLESLGVATRHAAGINPYVKRRIEEAQRKVNATESLRNQVYRLGREMEALGSNIEDARKSGNIAEAHNLEERLRETKKKREAVQAQLAELGQ